MRERTKTWASRVVFAASAFALLATSKPPEWKVAAAITGPTVATSGRALSLTIDASRAPRIEATGIPRTYLGGLIAPCLSRFTTGATLTCLLPPSATLTNVEIHGGCGGCSGPCAPPAGSFVKVTSKETDVWGDDARSSIPLMLPSHPKGWIGSRIEVTVSGAEAISVTLEARPHGGGATIFKEEQSCDLAPTGASASCTFLVTDAVLVSPGSTFDVEAKADGYGACASPACAPPKTVHIDGVRLL